MKSRIEVELKPFNIPNYAIAESNMTGEQSQSFPLSMVDENTLQRMCDEFTDAVFKKAGKSPPPTEMPTCPRCSYSNPEARG